MARGYSSGGSRQRWRKQGLSPREEAAGRHDEGGEEEGWREVLAEEKDGEQRTDEWREGIVSAGAGATDRALGVGVEIDTQTVRHKVQEQQDKHVLPRQKGIVLRQRKEQNTEARTEACERRANLSNAL